MQDSVVGQILHTPQISTLHRWHTVTASNPAFRIEHSIKEVTKQTGAFVVQVKLFLAKNYQKPTATTEALSLRRNVPIQVESSQVNMENLNLQLDLMFEECSAKRFENIPEYPMPLLLKKVNLFEYQKQGIRWLIHQERSGAVPNALPSHCRQKDDFSGYLCTITGSSMLQRPPPVRGGILADDMGLGKTIQTLALILCNPPEGQTYPISRRSFPTERPVPRCTLIVRCFSLNRRTIQYVAIADIVCFSITVV
jgi:SNF2-related domain